ncbi:aspartic peptidase domain-containing protein [Xylogone sp. PMI_703]|nr:aspartic peptidase domain-containing protein [Xylogone sp. PMI_703]
MLPRWYHVVFLAALTLQLGESRLDAGYLRTAALQERDANSSSSGFIPSPLVVPPSRFFDGIDGQWSSLTLSMGTPAQDVRVLVSTSSVQTVVVALDGCTTPINGVVPTNCTATRGGIFSASASSTWNGQGLFPISENGADLDGNLGFTEEAVYGLETIRLSNKGPSLNTQTTAVIVSSAPLYMGLFGLSAQPVTFHTGLSISAPSFFQTLRLNNLIPSLTWSYTAGASYRFSGGQFAQLIFGGSDSSRYRSNPVSFNITDNAEQDLMVAIQSIMYTSNGQSKLLKDPIYAFIDSTDPNFWLPESVCQAFELAFGISQDPTTGLYLLDSSQYDRISKMNPEVTFTLGNTLSGGESLNITLPFSAFTLPAAYPFVPNDTYKHYFPLRQSKDSSQYMLGRAFLQEAYVTADYDRSSFTVSQCIWEDGAPSQLVAILPPQFKTAPVPAPETASRSRSHRMGAGPIAGIVFGGIIGLLFIAIIFLLIRRHRLKAKFTPVAQDTYFYPNTNKPLSRMPTKRLVQTPTRRMTQLRSSTTARVRRNESTRVFPASIRGSLLSSISRTSSFGFPSTQATLSSYSPSLMSPELSGEGEVHQLSAESTLLTTPYELGTDYPRYFDRDTEYMGAGMTTESDTGLGEGRRNRVPFAATTNREHPDHEASTPMMNSVSSRGWL